MRQLHPVGLKEVFVASGVYTHYEDDQPTGSQEHWSIHVQPDGAQIIRVDDDWRAKDGSSVLIEAWVNPPEDGGEIGRFDIHAFGGKDDEIKEVRASFRFHPDHLEFGISIDKEPRRQMEMELPSLYIVAPESLIFGGLEAARLIQTEEQPRPVVSYLPTFYSEAAAFRPAVHYQSARVVDDESVEINGKSYAARHLEQHTPSIKQSWPLWMDKHDILLRFTGPDGRHSAVLTQYARRPEKNNNP